MDDKESDSESDAEAYREGRTAVDILRAPLELPRRVKRPPTVRHPVLTAPRKTSNYRPGSDFSQTFWHVVRQMRLEERANKITITELENSSDRNDEESVGPESHKDGDSSDGGLASGETSSEDESPPQIRGKNVAEEPRDGGPKENVRESLKSNDEIEPINIHPEI